MTRRITLPLVLVLLLAIALATAAAASELTMIDAGALDRRIDIAVDEPTSVKALYRAIGEASGLAIVFAPELLDQPIQVDLAATTARQGLMRLSHAAGHFLTPLDATTLLVATDTPPNRRLYQTEVLRTFYLENSHVKDVMTTLRTMLELKKIATIEDLQAFTVRDTPEQVALAEHLVARLEKERAEVDVEAHLLLVDPAALARATGDSVPLRLPPGQLEQLIRASGARVLAAPHVAAVAGTDAAVHVGEAVPIPVRSDDGGTSYQYQDVGFELQVRPTFHASDGAVTLEFRAGLSGALEGGDDGRPTVARRTTEAQVRLADGETYLLTDPLRVKPNDDGGFAVLPLLADDETEGSQLLLVALTPHIIRQPEITASDRKPLYVGSGHQLVSLAAESGEAPSPEVADAIRAALAKQDQ